MHGGPGWSSLEAGCPSKPPRPRLPHCLTGSAAPCSPLAQPERGRGQDPLAPGTGCQVPKLRLAPIEPRSVPQNSFLLNRTVFRKPQAVGNGSGSALPGETPLWQAQRLGGDYGAEGAWPLRSASGVSPRATRPGWRGGRPLVRAVSRNDRGVCRAPGSRPSDVREVLRSL